MPKLPWRFDMPGPCGQCHKKTRKLCIYCGNCGECCRCDLYSARAAPIVEKFGEAVRKHLEKEAAKGIGQRDTSEILADAFENAKNHLEGWLKEAGILDQDDDQAV